MVLLICETVEKKKFVYKGKSSFYPTFNQNPDWTTIILLMAEKIPDFLFILAAKLQAHGEHGRGEGGGGGRGFQGTDSIQLPRVWHKIYLQLTCLNILPCGWSPPPFVFSQQITLVVTHNSSKCHRLGEVIISLILSSRGHGPFASLTRLSELDPPKKQQVQSDVSAARKQSDSMIWSTKPQGGGEGCDTSNLQWFLTNIR